MHMRRTVVFAGLILAAANVPAQEPAEKVHELETRMTELEQRRETLREELRTWRRKLEAAEADRIDPLTPQFFLPRLPEAPVIDGAMEAGEWDHAIAVTTGCGIRGAGLRERPSAVFYIGWRPDAIYVAQRLPLREGEKLKRLNREPKHDNVHPSETAWEFYIDRGSTGSHPSLCRWQFMANAVGNKWDYENQYQIGQKYYDWDAEWELKQRLTPDGRYWEVEAVIPRTSVYQEAPIADGQRWKIGFATDLHNPWTWSGFYGWNVPATFKDQTPVIRMFHPERSLVVRGIGFDMDLVNTTDRPFKAEVVALVTAKARGGGMQEVARRSWPVELKPGAEKRLEISEPLGDAVADTTPYHLNLMVMQGDRSIYTWSRHFQYNAPDNKLGLAFEPDPWPFVADVGYAPISSYVRLMVDKYDYARADAVADAHAAILPAKGDDPIAEATLTQFQYGKAEQMVDVPALEPGAYRCRFALRDAAGTTLAERTETWTVRDLADYPWIGNELGMERVVPGLFEPLAAEGAELRAFEKTVTSDASGLPAAIAVHGDPLLARPIHVRGISGGEPFRMAPAEGAGVELKETLPAQARYSGRAAGGPLGFTSSVLWEYDSTARVRLELAPRGREAQFDALQVVIPFTPEAARNFMTVGYHMRQSCHAGAIPSNSGVAWDSTQVPFQRMTVGSFVPVVWVGNRSMGLTWFADSDEGWWPSDDRPAIELIRRDDGGADLVLNLAVAPVTLSEPRTIEFGLNINPVRPMSEHEGSVLTFGFLKEQGRWVPGRSTRKEFALRYPQDPEISREIAQAAHTYGKVYSPYTEMSAQDMPQDTYEYFKEEWAGPGFGLTPNRNSNDCVVYWSWRWFKDCEGDGYYFDNVFPRISVNPRNSTAYELPDGRVQPGYCMWAYREHFKRIRVLLDRMRPESRICIHNTRFQFAPVMAFADLAMGGEMATPHMGSPDFMAMYPRDFMEVMYNPTLWGYKLSHLYHFKNRSYVNEDGEYDRDAALKVHRSAMGTMLVHGVEFFQYIDYDHSLMQRYQLVKSLCGGRMEFIPWWKSDGRIELAGSSEDQAAAVWRGDKALVIIVTNFSEHDRHQEVTLDFPALLPQPGKGETRLVTDLEDMWSRQGQIVFRENIAENHIPRMNGLDTQTMIPNRLRVKVASRDVRVILVANVALAKGAGF